MNRRVVTTALIYALLLLAVGWRLEVDEARRSRKGEAVVAQEIEGDDRWRGALRGRSQGDDALAGLLDATSAVGWEAVARSGRPELEMALLSLVRHPAPNGEAAEVAISTSVVHRDIARALERSLEEGPLVALGWRGLPERRGAELAFDALGAPLEQTGSEYRSPVAEHGVPWGEAALQGALIFDLFNLPGGGRPDLASVGASRVDVARLVQPWCFDNLERLELAPCKPLELDAIPDPLEALKREGVPAQVAILWASSQLDAAQLATVVEYRGHKDVTRRRALMAFARKAHREEAVPHLERWLELTELPLGPVLAGLELLRLRQVASAPAIREAAGGLGPAEEVTLRWVADVLEEPARYAVAR